MNLELARMAAIAIFFLLMMLLNLKSPPSTLKFVSFWMMIASVALLAWHLARFVL